MIRYSLKNLLIRRDNVQFKSLQNLPILRRMCSISAKINTKNETIELRQVDKGSKNPKHFEFPFIWLRDNCHCNVCFHASSSSRIINWEKFDVAIKPKHIQYDNEKKVLKVKWNDASEHESEYNYEWLKARNFSEENRANYLKQHYRLAKNLWSSSDFSGAIKCFKFDEVVNNDMELYNWLKCLITNGVAIITDVPNSEKEARIIADRVGFIRKTHYGEEFTIKAKDGTSNVAYLSANLQMHTDLPYYDYAPGSNLLHCLVQSKSEGAENLLTDGFYVAEKMKREYPKEYELLSTVIVNWFDVGKEESTEFHSIYRAPMFCLDYDGQIERVNHSIPQRDSHFSVPIGKVKDWYNALSLFIKLIHSEAAEIKTKEGTILCFDNTRIIHGRREYKDTENNQRYLIGSYLDLDEIYSRFRVLQKQFE